MTALPLTGSKPRELLYISTELFDISINVFGNLKLDHFQAKR